MSNFYVKRYSVTVVLLFLFHTWISFSALPFTSVIIFEKIKKKLTNLDIFLGTFRFSFKVRSSSWHVPLLELWCFPCSLFMIHICWCTNYLLKSTSWLPSTYTWMLSIFLLKFSRFLMQWRRTDFCLWNSYLWHVCKHWFDHLSSLRTNEY